MWVYTVSTLKRGKKGDWNYKTQMMFEKIATE
jgi:hypothetical protein